MLGGGLIHFGIKRSFSGAALHQRDDHGLTALSLAGCRGHAAVARLLLSRGAKQTAQDDHGYTALHWAVLHGHRDVVEVLCAAPGASEALAMRTHLTSRTPLGLANHRLEVGCAAVLRAHGASE